MKKIGERAECPVCSSFSELELRLIRLSKEIVDFFFRRKIPRYLPKTLSTHIKRGCLQNVSQKRHGNPNFALSRVPLVYAAARRRCRRHHSWPVPDTLD